MGPTRAAQYLRMSTERQDYSIEGQGLANAAYAEARGYEVVRTFEDPGISGLTYRKRTGLQALLREVLSGAADFSVVLVYDVSRWGRFQDIDESAHYEFLCRSAGVPIEYTAEVFANDGSLIASMVKHMKRCMAAEYSRDLSEKISRAHRGYGAKGYWQGGSPGYGYRRLSLQRDGSPREVLQAGEWKGLSGGRVSLVPGPPKEVRVIRRIFALRLERLSTRAIADRLNADRIPSPTGGAWRWETVGSILRNEKYMGVKVTGQTRSRLGETVHCPPETWIRTVGAFPALVSRRVFRAAQAIQQPGAPRYTDQELDAALAAVLLEHGRLGSKVLRDDPRTPTPTTYVARFGSLSAAYARVGYLPDRKQRLAEERIRLHKPHLRRGRYARLWREDEADA